ncbi:MAG: SIMPL domain-containing protein [Solirubrobacterales bacterium]
MRLVIPAATVTTVSLIAAGLLGVASAEAPTASPARTVSVQGVATVPVAQGANLATATAAYRQGMAAAVADGQAKAEFLAGKAGATLGSVQSIAEGGGYIGCTGGEEPGGGEYTGEQPDFGSTGVAVSPAAPRVLANAAPGIRKPVVKHRKKKRKRPLAKHASVVSCTLSTQVSLTYLLV